MQRGTAGLRLMVFDRTCRDAPVGLSRAWSMGGRLYRQLGRLDGFLGASSWQEALQWLVSFEAGRPLQQIQFWGHGKWGCALIDRQPLDRSCLAASQPLRPLLDRITPRLAGPDALLWFRTCETLGAVAGQDFACALTDRIGCRVAGHTHIIGFYQSGLHSLAPGEQPTWPADEGLRRGTPAAPGEALASRPWAPNTITCLTGRIPEGF